MAVNSIKIFPRQSGKTTRLLNTLLSSPTKILIVATLEQKKNIERMLTRLPDKNAYLALARIYSGTELSTVMFSELPCINEILIEEYLFFSTSNKKILYSIYREYSDQYVFTIETTSNMLYNHKIIELIKKLKRCNINDIYQFSWAFDSSIRKEIEDIYWYNLLTEPGFKVESIIDFNLPIEQRMLQVIGEWLK